MVASIVGIRQTVYSVAMKRFVTYRTLAASLLAAIFFVASTAQAQLTEVRSIDAVTEYSLPNGLQVLLLPDADKPVATVNITYRVGSRHEGMGQTGSAHLLEHMLFKASGSINNPKQEATKRAIRWNGTTNADRTNYFGSFQTGDGQAADRMDFMLGWLAGMMAQARFTRADLDSEMTVVRNEFERAENDTGRVLGERIRAMAFNYHGYGHSTLGARSDIENVSLDTLYAFYRKHYRPDNATLIIAGRFDIAQVKTKIVEAFGPITKPAAHLPSTYTIDAVQDGERNVVLRRVGGYANTAVLYRMPAGGVREGAIAQLLAETMGQKDGPLEKNLVNAKMGVTHWAFYAAQREPGYLMAGIGLPERASQISEEQYIQQAQSSALALAKVMEFVQPTDSEIITARNNMMANQRMLMRDTLRIASALSETVALGDWRLLYALPQIIETVNADEVRALARSFLIANNRTSGTFLPLADPATAGLRAPTLRIPADKDLLAFDAASFNASIIKNKVSATSVVSVPSFDITPKAMAQFTQVGRLRVNGADGLQIAVLPRATKSNRVVGTLRLRFASLEALKGTGAEPALLAVMLVNGTKSMSSVQLQARFVELDASLNFTSDVGVLNARLDFPAAQLVPVLELLNEILRDPRFADEDFIQQHNAMLARFTATKSSPDFLASQTIRSRYVPPGRYAEDDPRAFKNSVQTEATIRKANVQTLRNYWNKFASAQAGEMVLSGPIELAAVQNQLQKLWGDWYSQYPYQEWPPTEHAKPVGEANSTIQVADKANAAYLAQIAFPLNEFDPDFPALVIATQLLSEQGLFQRIREKEGLSYAVGASVQAPKKGDAAAITISASFAPQNRDKLRQSIREVLKEKQASGFTPTQVNTAVANILSSRSSRFSQVDNALVNIADNLRFGYALDFSDKITQSYETLNTAKIDSVLKKYVDVDSLVEVQVGTFDSK